MNWPANWRRYMQMVFMNATPNYSLMKWHHSSVRRKTGEMRKCVDYRPLNKISLRDNYPMALAVDCIEHLGNKSFFTSMDLKNGFNKIKMHEDSVKYTSYKYTSSCNTWWPIRILESTLWIEKWTHRLSTFRLPSFKGLYYRRPNRRLYGRHINCLPWFRISCENCLWHNQKTSVRGSRT